MTNDLKIIRNKSKGDDTIEIVSKKIKIKDSEPQPKTNESLMRFA